jgi:hypothetical protein
MSVNNRFELYKVKREIKRSGKVIDFFRTAKNEFGEPIPEGKHIHSIKGVYYQFAAHQLDTYIVEFPVDAGIGRTKRTPQLLCTWEDLFFLNEDGEDDMIKVGDWVNLNGKVAKVVGVVNVMEWNTIAHITFAEVDYGTITGSRPGFEFRDKKEFDWQNLS